MRNDKHEYDRVEIHPSGVKVYFKQGSDGHIYMKTVVPKHVSPKMAALFMGIEGLLTSRPPKPSLKN